MEELTVTNFEKRMITYKMDGDRLYEEDVLNDVRTRILRVLSTSQPRI